MLESTYINFRNLMTLQSNISISQLILAVISTVATVLVIVIGAYINLRVAEAERETRLGIAEVQIKELKTEVQEYKRETTTNYQDILKMLGEIKTELRDKQNRPN